MIHNLCTRSFTFFRTVVGEVFFGRTAETALPLLAVVVVVVVIIIIIGGSSSSILAK